MNYDEYYIGLCYKIAEKSKDPSTKVGCIIVYQDNVPCSFGFNGFARGVMEEESLDYSFNGKHFTKEDAKERWENREIKYPLIVHSETNAIYNAGRHGHVLAGCKLYIPWHPCSACANGIVQAGIVEVILDGNFEQDPELMKRWEKEHNLAKMIFKEGGVHVRMHNSEEKFYEDWKKKISEFADGVIAAREKKD